VILFGARRDIAPCPIPITPLATIPTLHFQQGVPVAYTKLPSTGSRRSLDEARNARYGLFSFFPFLRASSEPARELEVSVVLDRDGPAETASSSLPVPSIYPPYPI